MFKRTMFDEKKIEKISEKYSSYTAHAVLENHLYECENKLKEYMVVRSHENFVEISKELGDILVLCEILIQKGIDIEMGNCSYEPNFTMILGQINIATYLKNESKKKGKKILENNYRIQIRDLYYTLMKLRESYPAFKEIVDQRPDRFLEKIEGDK